MFVGSKQVLEGVEPDFIFLNVRVYQDHAFNTVVNTVTHKIKLKKKLFAKHEPEVCLTKQLVYEWVISPNQLVLNVLQNAAKVGQREDFVFTFILHLFVYFVIKSKVLHRRHLVIRSNRLTELRQDQVACLNHKIEIRATAFLIE